ncbi:hypothetical protein Mapa_013935 [Marchantia paleacea]|nr:hypothetical protein Mapa_013935 [Marchantia paleacea]
MTERKLWCLNSAIGTFSWVGIVEMAGKSKKGGGGGAPSKLSRKKDGHAKSKKKLAEDMVLKFAGVDRLSSRLFDLHCHSTCSDGHLSPEFVVARAYRNGLCLIPPRRYHSCLHYSRLFRRDA